MAEGRLRSLGRRLSGARQLASKYRQEVEKLVSKGWAEKVPLGEVDTHTPLTWYLPHHAVIAPQKEKPIFKSFKVTIPMSSIDELLAENMWPSGICVRRFYTTPQPWRTKP